jgi:hypothetical protein
MQFKKLLAAAAIGAAFIGGSLATTPALAQHYHGGYYHGGYGGGWHGGYYGGWRGGWYGPRVGFYFGPGYFPGDYWGYPGYYAGFYPWGYVGYAGYPEGDGYVAPSNYIEQGQQPAASTYSWYRCDSANGGYYPYVKECPGGWTKVAPSAPQQ